MLFFFAAGEAYHSCEAKDTMMDRESLFAIDGVTGRADCDATYDFDSANKLNLIPVFFFLRNKIGYMSSWVQEVNIFLL